MNLRLVILLTFCVVWANPTASATADDHPNVLLIMVDDLNDWIGCLQGHPQTLTPNMDRLAERGILFTNAHCAAPICRASRTALFCGRYPDQTGVYDNTGKTPARDLHLPVHLEASGYETLGTGKLLHSKSSTYFDDYFTTEQRWSPFSKEQVLYTPDELPSKSSDTPRHAVQAGPGDRDWILPLNGLTSERKPNEPAGESFDWGPVAVAYNEMGDVLITNWALEQIRKSRSQPFFMGVGFYRPHIPLFAPQQDFERLPSTPEIQLPAILASDLDDIGELGRQWALEAMTAGTHELVTQHQQWRQATRAYLACVTFVDRQIGRILDALDSSPHADNTWIILCSDHGWHLGEKQHWGKMTGWQRATRVPLMIVPPQQQTTARGQRCAEPVNLIDLYPTLLEVCHVPVKAGLSGVSLTPWIADPALTTNRSVVTTFGPGNHALSTRDWRLIRYSNGEEELYDLTNDPHEWFNLARSDSQADSLNMMRQLLNQHLQEFGVPE